MSTPVLLVFANPVYYPQAQPYGLQILKSLLSYAGIDTEIIQPYMEENPNTALLEICLKKKPAIVGLSFRNLDTAGFHYLSDGEEHFLKELSDMVYAVQNVGAIAAIGGSGFSIAPKEILEIVGADIGFVGTSEHDFSVFCKGFLESRNLSNAVKGLHSVILPGTNPPPPPKVTPGKAFFIDKAGVEYAYLGGGTIPIRTKTGCTLRCNYCVVPSIEKLNLRPWKDIKQELQLIQKAELADRVFIADGEFNLPSISRSCDISKKIYNNFGTEIEWRCYLEAGYVTETLIRDMKKAGCVGISLTVDSYSDLTRRGFNKTTKADKAIEATQICLDAGINLNINLLFGGPNETIKTAIESAETGRTFYDQGATVAVTIGLRVYPYTDFEKQIQLDRYMKHYRKCKTIDWLGAFCSPVSSDKLAKYIQKVLPPAPKIPYTNTIQEKELAFYKKLAFGAGLLSKGECSNALIHFQDMREQYPERQEVELGELKAKYKLEN